MPAILALRKLRQGNRELEASLDYIRETLSEKKEKKEKQPSSCLVVRSKFIYN